MADSKLHAVAETPSSDSPRELAYTPRCMLETQAVTARIARAASLGLLVLFVWQLTSCSSTRVPVRSADEPGSSDTTPAGVDVDASAAAGDRTADLVWAVHEPIDLAHAPVGENAAETVLFAHLYETLFEMTAQGPQPRLAESAVSLDGGRTWNITLRSGVRFSDGSQMRSSDVLSAWRITHRVHQEQRGRLPWILVPGPVQTIGDRSFELVLPFAVPDLPRVLCHPGLAVAVPRPASSAKLGTGPYRLAPDPRSDPGTGVAVPGSASPADEEFMLAPNEYASTPGTRRVRARVQTRRDPRDFVSSEADVWFTADRAALAYAESRGWRIRPSGYGERTYAVVARAGAENLDALLAEVGESRNLRCDVWPPDPWIGESGVPARTLEVWRTEGLPDLPVYRVIHARDDFGAGAVAERLAALLTTPNRQVFAVGVAPIDLTAAARRGSEFVSVFALDPIWNAPCWAPAELWLRCPWTAVARHGFSGVVRPRDLHPLFVVTRPGVVLNTGGSGSPGF